MLILLLKLDDVLERYSEENILRITEELRREFGELK